jgi:Flp pilus assembly pilin Flp
MIRLVRDFVGERKGITLVEYALIAGLLTLACVAILTTMGSVLSNFYSSLNSSLSSA